MAAHGGRRKKQLKGESGFEKLELAALQARLTKLLSPRELECVQLRAEGLRYEEIAAALDVNTVCPVILTTRLAQSLQRPVQF